MWKKILIVVLILGIVGAGYFFVTSKKSASTTTNVVQVKTLAVKPESLETKIDADGTVTAKDEQEIKASNVGIITEVYVKEGSVIEEGDQIIRLDDESLQNSLNTTRLSYAEAEQSYQKLLSRFKSQDEENRIKLAEASDNVEIAKSSLNKEQISLENQRATAETRVDHAEDQLVKIEKEYENKKILLEKGAISRKELEQTEDALDKAKEDYLKSQEELKVLVEETIPTSLKLSQLKITNAENQIKLLESSIQNSKVTKSELEVAKLRVKTALNNLQDLEDKLEKLVTSSPMSGTVIQLVAKKGDKIVEGVTIGKVASVDELIIEAWIDEIHINQTQLGQKVSISSDAFEQELEGKVISIAPIATKQGNINRFKAEVEIIDNLGLLRPGMFVNTEIQTNYLESTLSVPPLAVLGEEEKYVFVLKDGIAEKREVELGLRTLTKVEVKGINEGEKVIVGPYPVLKTLQPGTAVVDMQNQGNQ